MVIFNSKLRSYQRVYDRYIPNLGWMASLILSAFAKKWKITELPSKVIQFSGGLLEIGHGYTTRIYNYIYNYICVCDRWDIYIYILDILIEIWVYITINGNISSINGNILYMIDV